MPTIGRHCSCSGGAGWLMGRRLLSFIPLFSQPGYILLTGLAVARQTGRCGASVYTSGWQQIVVLGSSGQRLERGWRFGRLVADGVSIVVTSETHTATPLHLFPDRPFILILPWWDFHVHEFQCNDISIALHVNKLKGKKKKIKKMPSAQLKTLSVNSGLFCLLF